MIKLSKDPVIAKEYARRILTDKGNYISPKTKLENWIKSASNGGDKRTMEYVLENLEYILISEPKILQEIKDHMTSSGLFTHIYDTNGSTLTPLGKKIDDFFGYDRFRKSAKAVWLSKKLNIKSCVYCNTQYGLTVDHNGKTKLLFHIDHYFPQKIYPFLSLSFYNLIPCCASCNMSKTANEYNLSDNIHPYEEDVHTIAKYKVDKGTLTRYLMNLDEDDIKIKLELRGKYLGNKLLEKKLNHFKSEFKLESQYRQFTDIAAEIFLKSVYYNSSRKKEIINFFKTTHSINIDEELIHRFIIGNYTENKDLLKRPLAKLMKDLGEQVHII
ncbi:hypothetical protein APR41_05200 [Salegentibacter salinarum]|uniref:HNH nuclease domain-containing protein n=1 Tax=Salegentibacter salinarum TaxID=447422 RepID=A0A2N0TSE4_9FLAO|nr:hypothetical protein [Salegentibacter salinarum]PKD17608.1 hypothetical protein APR41_05200 [Salegentibacter salinarum]SKB49603.1 hypothetical protein SAMN05660903_01065 [Salegentibacter salinarum]